MKRIGSIVAIAAALALVTGAVASANGIVPPTVTKSVSPTDVNVAGSGSGEEFTVTIEVTGGGGTSSTITPMDVVFAIDSSGSMTTNDPSGLRKTAAKSFVDLMDSSRDTGGVVSWDTGINFTYGLSNDFTTLKSRIDNVDSSGGTNLEVGLQAAVNMLNANTRTDPSAEVIVFLTDGIGTYTGAATAAAKAQGYVIYAIGLGSPNMGPLNDMASQTGGQAYNAPTAENLQAIFDAIFEEVVTSTIPHNVDVVEVTQSYIIDEGSFNIAPDSIVTDGSGITTITWLNVGQYVGDNNDALDADETVTLTFTARSDTAGENLPVQVEGSAVVNYKDRDGNDAGSVAIPQDYIDVNTPPDTSGAYADPGCLWPPNHKFVAISILGVTDADGDEVTITVTGVTSDEPTATDEGSGGAKHAPDAVINDDGTVEVRAERSGDGDGRVYVISFEAEDSDGAVSEGTVEVRVPHDQKGKDCDAVDSGQYFDAAAVN